MRDIVHYADRAEICVVPTLCPLEGSCYDYSINAGLIDRAAGCAQAWVAAGGLQATGVPHTLLEHTH